MSARCPECGAPRRGRENESLRIKVLRYLLNSPQSFRDMARGKQIIQVCAKAVYKLGRRDSESLSDFQRRVLERLPADLKELAQTQLGVEREAPKLEAALPGESQ